MNITFFSETFPSSSSGNFLENQIQYYILTLKKYSDDTSEIQTDVTPNAGHDLQAFIGPCLNTFRQAKPNIFSLEMNCNTHGIRKNKNPTILQNFPLNISYASYLHPYSSLFFSWPFATDIIKNQETCQTLMYEILFGK